MKRIHTLLACAAMALMGAAQAWQPDILGDGYQMRYVDQGGDYSGDVRSTVVRKQSPCGSKRAVLYVHGYNDYFFQRELGDRMVDSCFNFYAVDLRKYGRSLMPGQRKFEVRDLREYFADIDSALAIMKADGIEQVALMGHSTGGLITSLYMNEQPDSIVKTLILNSPFLDWNMSNAMRRGAIPAVGALAAIAPRMPISNGESTAYGESLLKGHHGEWEYNTDWKTFYPEKVTPAWLHAIEDAQWSLASKHNISVPVLLMHSDKSVYGDKWTPEFQEGDAVLNVEDISKRGRQLGAIVSEVVIPDGLHDLILSNPVAREQAYQEIFTWLDAPLVDLWQYKND